MIEANHSALDSAQKIISPLAIDSVHIDVGPEFSIEVGDLRFKAGNIVSLLGKNGSGKTTLIEALLALRKCARLEASIFGRPVQAVQHDIRTLRRIGVQLQVSSYHRNAKVREVIDLHRRLYERQEQYILEAFSIGEIANLQYQKLSRGEKQRVDLSVALLHVPELVFLDEPTTSLDSHFCESFAAVLEYVIALQPSTTVLMASHSERDVRLATHLLWLKDGLVQRFTEAAQLLSESLGEIKAVYESADESTNNTVLQATASMEGVVHTNRLSPTRTEIYAHDCLTEKLIDLAKSGRLRQFSLSAVSGCDLLGYINHE